MDPIAILDEAFRACIDDQKQDVRVTFDASRTLVHAEEYIINKRREGYK